MPIDADAYMCGAIPTLSRGGSWLPQYQDVGGSATSPHAAQGLPLRAKTHLPFVNQAPSYVAPTMYAPEKTMTPFMPGISQTIWSPFPTPSCISHQSLPDATTACPDCARRSYTGRHNLEPAQQLQQPRMAEAAPGRPAGRPAYSRAPASASTIPTPRTHAEASASWAADSGAPKHIDREANYSARSHAADRPDHSMQILRKRAIDLPLANTAHSHAPTVRPPLMRRGHSMSSAGAESARARTASGSDSVMVERRLSVRASVPPVEPASAASGAKSLRLRDEQVPAEAKRGPRLHVNTHAPLATASTRPILKRSQTSPWLSAASATFDRIPRSSHGHVETARPRHQSSPRTAKHDADLEDLGRRSAVASCRGDRYDFTTVKTALPSTSPRPTMRRNLSRASPDAEEDYDRYTAHPATRRLTTSSRSPRSPSIRSVGRSVGTAAASQVEYIPLGYARPTKELEWNRDGPAMKTHGVAWKRYEEGVVLPKGPEGPRWVQARPPPAEAVGTASWWES